MQENPRSEKEPLGELAKRLVHDVNTLAKDHVDLARIELGNGLKSAAIDAVAGILGGVTGLIGFAMLCATLVMLLEPVIAPLWARMLISSVVYLVLGGVISLVMIRKLKRDVPPNLSRTKHQAKVTTEVLKEQVQHG